MTSKATVMFNGQEVGIKFLQPVIEEGAEVTCPCGTKFILEEWQIYDGPCMDGCFHCFGEDDHGCCGCHDPREK